MTRKIRQFHRVRLWAAAAAVGAATCAAPVAVAQTAQAAPGRDAVTTAQATVTVNLAGKTAGGIGSHFMGLSFESGTLSNGQRYDAVGNLPQLLKNLGPGLLRLGGNSADLSSFTGITQPVADGLARLLKAAGWQAIYTENLLNFNAATVTADAKLVGSTLGSSLYAFACGNEPDMYVPDKAEPSSYGTGNYLSGVTACNQAIKAGYSSAQFAGPDIAWQPAWLTAYAGAMGATAKALTAHYYPLGCANDGTSASQQASALLSASMEQKEVSRFQGYEAVAQKYTRPLRVSETNSACNGGAKGVSNSYASALWVIDYMLTAAEQGIAGMNFHGGLNTLCDGYTVLCSTATNSGRYTPQPIYYGMLFARLFGTGAFLPVTVSTPSSDQHVVAFADKPPAGAAVHVMVENLGSQSTTATLQLAGYTGTSVQVDSLSGGSPLATSGIEIQGSSVAADGTFTPHAASTVTCTAGTCPLALAPYSAAVVTLSAA